MAKFQFTLLMGGDPKRVLWPLRLQSLGTGWFSQQDCQEILLSVLRVES